VGTKLSRDEIVERGMTAQQRGAESHGPWIYQYKVKSGLRKTRNVEKMYYNIPHLMADAIVTHARDNERLSVYGMKRLMKSTLRSIREDI
jgi:hypothetical protein